MTADEYEKDLQRRVKEINERTRKHWQGGLGTDDPDGRYERQYQALIAEPTPPPQEKTVWEKIHDVLVAAGVGASAGCSTNNEETYHDRVTRETNENQQRVWIENDQRRLKEIEREECQLMDSALRSSGNSMGSGWEHGCLEALAKEKEKLLKRLA